MSESVRTTSQRIRYPNSSFPISWWTTVLLSSGQVNAGAVGVVLLEEAEVEVDPPAALVVPDSVDEPVLLDADDDAVTVVVEVLTIGAAVVVV